MRTFLNHNRLDGKHHLAFEELAVRLLGFIQGEDLMRVNRLFKNLIIISAVVFSFGCSVKTLQEDESTFPLRVTVTPKPTEFFTSTREEVLLLHVLSGHNKRVLDVEFSAQNNLLASSSQDLKIILWDAQSGEAVHSFQMRSVDMADIDITPGGDLLASGEAIWDLVSMQEIHVLERGSHYPAHAAFSPDGSMLALGLFEQQITLWDAASGQPLYQFDRQAENRTKSMEFSPDGAILAVGVIDGTVRLLDVASGEIINVLAYSGETDIHHLTFSPEGKYLASGGRLSAVILWDVASWEVARTFGLTDNAISMDFSPDGSILATAGGREFEVRLWDVETGRLLHSLPHYDQLSAIAFSPDGTLLAVGCFDGNIYLWSMPSIP